MNLLSWQKNSSLEIQDSPVILNQNIVTMTMKQNTDMMMITMMMITMTMITMTMITMAMKQRRNMITTRVRIAALFPGLL